MLITLLYIDFLCVSLIIFIRFTPRSAVTGFKVWTSLRLLINTSRTLPYHNCTTVCKNAHLFQLIFTGIYCHLKKKKRTCPGWCASVGWVLSCKMKGRGFHFWSAHMPRLWVWPLFGVLTKSHQSMFPCHINVSLPPPKRLWQFERQRLHLIAAFNSYRLLLVRLTL